MSPENWFWKDAGCREDSSTWVGQMKVSAKHVTKRKAQKSAGSTIAKKGTRSDVRSQKLSESGSRKQELQRRNGSGKKGIVTHPLSESQWNTGHFSLKKVGVGEAQELVHASRSVQRPCCN